MAAAASEHLHNGFDGCLKAEEAEVARVPSCLLSRFAKEVFDVGGRQAEQISVAKQFPEPSLVYVVAEGSLSRSAVSSSGSSSSLLRASTDHSLPWRQRLGSR